MITAWSSPTIPQVFKKREAVCNSKPRKDLYTKYYPECLKSIMQELQALDKTEEGVKVNITGKEYIYIYAHLNLFMIIRDTEGHDKICGHFCSYSASIILRMSHDCNIPMPQGDKLEYNCSMSRTHSLKQLVRDAMDTLDARVYGKSFPLCLKAFFAMFL